MYSSDYCDVCYHKDYNVVLVKWKKFCSFEEYRLPLSYALKIIQQYDNCQYVADTRDGFENHPDDTKWVADKFIPEIADAGCKCIYFIIDKENNLKDELEGQEKDSSDKIAFRYIYDLKDIETLL